MHRQQSVYMRVVLRVCNLTIYGGRSAANYSLIVLELAGTQRERSTTRQPPTRTLRSFAVSRVCDWDHVLQSKRYLWSHQMVRTRSSACGSLRMYISIWPKAVRLYEAPRWLDVCAIWTPICSAYVYAMQCRPFGDANTWSAYPIIAVCIYGFWYNHTQAYTHEPRIVSNVSCASRQKVIAVTCDGWNHKHFMCMRIAINGWSWGDWGRVSRGIQGKITKYNENVLFKKKTKTYKPHFLE